MKIQNNSTPTLHRIAQGATLGAQLFTMAKIGGLGLTPYSLPAWSLYFSIQMGSATYRAFYNRFVNKGSFFTKKLAIDLLISMVSAPIAYSIGMVLKIGKTFSLLKTLAIDAVSETLSELAIEPKGCQEDYLFFKRMLGIA